MLFLGFLLVSSCMALPLDVDETESTNAKSGNLKAASPLTNCGCQCSSLTFSDSAGVVQGNCRTVDGSGARWCYVDAALGSSCQDLTPSARYVEDNENDDDLKDDDGNDDDNEDYVDAALGSSCQDLTLSVR